MSDLEYPKVLVVGINPWIDNTGINTLINFFDGWDKSFIAHIYTKPKFPNTHICDKFFRISEHKVVKSVFNRKVKTGDVVIQTAGIMTCVSGSNMLVVSQIEEQGDEE